MILISLVAFMALAAPAGQASHPSFDCTRASTGVEHAICADPALGRLDRAMADRYLALHRRLEPQAAAALQGDQQWFLFARDEWFENRDRAGFRDFANLSERMTDRIAFLESIEPEGSESLIGHWDNLSGGLDITLASPGHLHLAFSTAQPDNARWLCDVEMAGESQGRTIVAAYDDEPGWRVRVNLKNGFIQVEESFNGETQPGQAPYCGHGGYVSGAYFRKR